MQKNNPVILAVIPARSGSKGFPDKNIYPLAGKPLLAHTITAALDSCIFASVIVSTDSQRYAQIAQSYGACVPFLRSAETSTDVAGSWAVVREVLDTLRDCGKHYDIVALLQPTSPLRTAKHIKEAFALYDEKNANIVVSVTECDYSPLICNTLDDTLTLDGFLIPEHIHLRRQDMPTFYNVNGAIYITDIELFINSSEPFNPYKAGAYAYVMPAEVSVDIDNRVDMALAEVIINMIGNN